MIVVSDNGPIGFLVQIGRIDLLPRLYKTVLLPRTVLTELLHASTPVEIREWIASPPSWVQVREPIFVVDVRRAGRGEREAIQLAKEQSAFLLCDDRAAVAQARREGLRVTGTLGILQVGHAMGWIEIEDALGELRARTQFRFPGDSRLTEIVREAHDLHTLRE